ncbi:hypothetical protein BDW59DRAFT_139230 [Aspergillus cavernicola]|uniref:Uncharacterized protein n=1 Tax=Aspergillus cavernicola TaxID=176166 RepID=A0ABR4IXI7_9EURO
MPQSSLFFKRKDLKNHEESSSETQEVAALTTVYCGHNPMVDIVAIHGLNGDPFKSFTTEVSQNFWLKDLLPNDIPNCRVLTFSYPASVVKLLGRPSSGTILEHTTTLVQELAADR